jgi:hypothetical protein
MALRAVWRHATQVVNSPAFRQLVLSATALPYLMLVLDLAG